MNPGSLWDYLLPVIPKTQFCFCRSADYSAVSFSGLFLDLLEYHTFREKYRYLLRKGNKCVVGSIVTNRKKAVLDCSKCWVLNEVSGEVGSRQTNKLNLVYLFHV